MGHLVGLRREHNRKSAESVSDLIVLMSAGLVIAIWGIAEGRLVDIFSNALDTVCGGIGC
jgi:hypothetical protein